MMKGKIFFFSLIFFLGAIASAQNPGEHWMRFKNSGTGGLVL
jgi:hypothetical protein